MKILRIYLVPDARMWSDFPVDDDATMASLWAGIVQQGVAAGPLAVIPQSSIHSLLLLDIAAPSKPNLTTFPGGKS